VQDAHTTSLLGAAQFFQRTKVLTCGRSGPWRCPRWWAWLARTDLVGTL